MQRAVWIVILVLMIVVVAVLAANRREFLPERSPFERGWRVAQQAGCFSCHALPGGAGAVNPKLAREGGLDAVRATVPSFFAERYEPETLRQWILNGVSDAKKASESYMESRERKALKMPAYATRLDRDEIDQLMVYISIMARREAAVGAGDGLPPGERLARRFACFDCHGELGQGGVANPGSFKGYIPGFFGWDFGILTDHGDRESLRQWLADGMSQSFLNRGFLGLRPVALFTERQAIKMPAYGEFLSDQELDQLIDYTLALQSMGPLDLAGFAAYRERYGAPVRAEPAPAEDSPAVAVADAGLSFLADVKPILETYCVDCHGPKRQKSGYRMDSREVAFLGGEIAEFLERPVISPGAPDDSLLVVFAEAQEEDEENDIYPMPPLKRRQRPSAEQIAVLRRWIAEGASWPEGATLSLPEKP